MFHVEQQSNNYDSNTIVLISLPYRNLHLSIFSYLLTYPGQTVNVTLLRKLALILYNTHLIATKYKIKDKLRCTPVIIIYQFKIRMK